MRFFELENGDPLVVLRAFKLVALANGEFHEMERALLRTAARCLSVDVDPDAIRPIQPDTLAAALPNEADRRMALQGAILMALADTEPTKDEVRVLHALRDALGVDEGVMRSLEKLAAGHRTLAMIEMMRRAPVLPDILERNGLGALARIVLQASGLQLTDKEVAAKYVQLGLLPEGTLGREFFRHCRDRGFGFPGEKGGLQTFTVQHDFLHVLTGYDTDPEGEMQIAAFTGGMRRGDSFFFLFFPTMMFNVGVGPTQVAGVHTTVGLFDPDKLFRAMDRGARVKQDLLSNWDYWPDVELSVEEVRSKYQIGPA